MYKVLLKLFAGMGWGGWRKGGTWEWGGKSAMVVGGIDATVSLTFQPRRFEGQLHKTCSEILKIQSTLFITCLLPSVKYLIIKWFWGLHIRTSFHLAKLLVMDVILYHTVYPVSFDFLIVIFHLYIINRFYMFSMIIVVMSCCARFTSLYTYRVICVLFVTEFHCLVECYIFA